MRVHCTLHYYMSLYAYKVVHTQLCVHSCAYTDCARTTSFVNICCGFTTTMIINDKLTASLVKLQQLNYRTSIVIKV